MFTCVEFKTTYKGERATDHVLLAPVGEGYDKSQTWHPIPHLRPKEGKDANPVQIGRWAEIEPAYEAWRKGEEIPEDGTALAAWAGVTKEQAAVFKSMGIRTVEAVAEMGDSTIDRLPFPNRRELKKTAKAFLEGRGAAALSDELVAAQERIAAMEAMLAEMTAPEKAAKTK